MAKKKPGKRFDKFLKMCREFKKDPEFRKALHEFVRYHTT